MNSRMRTFFLRTKTWFWLSRLLALALIAFCFASWVIADEQDATRELTVHEWGTFTAIAGDNGKAVEWAPLTGSTDLPGFVEHIIDENFKLGLRGTIRMETPVLYFYSPRDVTLSVKVEFAKGVITEWYPHAQSVQPRGVLRNSSLSQLERDGSITWDRVAVSPNLNGDFRCEDRSDRYYAARATSSTPLRVKTAVGDQQEKFLFYRGVSAAPLPLSATQNADGELLVKSLDGNEIPAVILFERRGERVGYRLIRGLVDEMTIGPQILTGSLNSLQGDLEEILIDQGLYPDEAHAMVQTWGDSWSEEGSRLIYIVPRGFVDKILPLTISPTPAEIIRVFVGRLEIVTPATATAVGNAIASNDDVTLNKYGRFLEPILQNLKKKDHTEPTAEIEKRQ